MSGKPPVVLISSQRAPKFRVRKMCPLVPVKPVALTAAVAGSIGEIAIEVSPVRAPAALKAQLTSVNVGFGASEFWLT